MRELLRALREHWAILTLWAVLLLGLIVVQNILVIKMAEHITYHVIIIRR